MFEQDYLMRILVEFLEAMRRSMERAEGLHDMEGAAQSLEDAVGSAVDLDKNVLLSLAPESIATVLEVSGTDPKVTEYVARSLLLAASYHGEAGHTELSQLRVAQALAIAEAYGHDLSGDDATEESARAFLDQAQQSLHPSE